jgi:hypothetical protein
MGEKGFLPRRRGACCDGPVMLPMLNCRTAEAFNLPSFTTGTRASRDAEEDDQSREFIPARGELSRSRGRARWSWRRGERTIALEKPTPAAMRRGLRKAEWKMWGVRRREAMVVVVWVVFVVVLLWLW